jgi:hypothetical protein
MKGDISTAPNGEKSVGRGFFMESIAKWEKVCYNENEKEKKGRDSYFFRN